jgi:chromosome partitioning protein
VTSIAVSSQKGGVGKTTVSINLAHAFARAGVKTLLLDADPQGSVGLSLTRRSRLLTGFYDYLSKPGLPAEKAIVPTRLPTLSLSASGQAGDYEAGGGVTGAHVARIRSFLDAAAGMGFELCIIDTAAGLFGVSGDVIAASDAVMVLQQAEPLGIRSVPKLLEGLSRVRILHPRLSVLGVCLTMVQDEIPESREAGEALAKLLPDNMVFETRIPRDSLFLRASARGLPVGIIEDGAVLRSVFDALRLETETRFRARNLFRNP